MFIYVCILNKYHTIMCLYVFIYLVLNTLGLYLLTKNMKILLDETDWRH